VNHCLSGLAIVVLAGSLIASPDGDKGPAKKQDPADPTADLQDLQGLDHTSRYLEVVAALRKRRADAVQAGQDDRRRLLDQFLAPEEAAVGRYHKAMRLVDGLSPAFPAGAGAELDGYEARDAVRAILELAARHRVVMINEAHHVPRHRAFASLLLAGLRQQGFRYFAAETFNPEDMPDLAKRGYPTLETGGYCSEPVFGDLVRQALRLGYTPVAYEYGCEKPPARQTDTDAVLREIAEREEGEARNLKKIIFDKDPRARVVVFAGYSHIRKVPQVLEKKKKAEIKWMAARFKERTGIEPLSVDQTTVMEHADHTHEHPAYRLVMEKKMAGERPVVLFDARAGRYYVPADERGAFDLVVFHPRDGQRDGRGGRPAWLRMGGYRKEMKVAGLPAAPRGGSLLVQAVARGEDEATAIPVDQVEYRAGESRPLLLLPRGAYRVRVVDAAGLMVHERELKVE
jgi:hypothetical protein